MVSADSDEAIASALRSLDNPRTSMHIRHVGLITVLLILVLVAQLVPVISRPVIAETDTTLQVLSVHANGVRFELRVPPYNLSSTGAAQALTIAGLEQDTAAPGMPVRYAVLAVPPTGAVELRLSEPQPQVRRQMLRLPKPDITPPGPPLGVDGEVGVDVRHAHVRAATLDGCTDDPVRITGEAWIRDQRIVTVALHPLLYCAERQELRWYPRLAAELRWTELLPDLTRPHRGADDPVIGELLQGLVLNPTQARTWRSQGASPQSDQLGSQHQLGSQQQPGTVRYKISVSRPGLYALTYADLESAGVPVTTIDPRTMRLSNQGQAVAIRVEGEADGRFDPGDRLFFYGEELSNGPVLDSVILNGQLTVTETVVSRNYSPLTEYSTTNVYWLEFSGSPSPRMAVVEATPRPSDPEPAFYRAEVRAEVQFRWWADPLTRPDVWLWDEIRVSGPTALVATFGITRTFPITITAPFVSGSPADVYAELVPFTSSPVIHPDHRTRVAFNTAVVEDREWDGPRRHQVQGSVPAAALVNGLNNLAVGIFRQPGITNEIIYLDFYTLRFDRQFVAEADQLDFRYTQTGDWRFRASGFSSGTVVVVDLSDPRQPRWLSGVQSDGIGISQFSQRVVGAARFLMVGATGIRSPESIERQVVSQLYLGTNQADYIYIAPNSLITATQTLATYRAAEGLRTLVVPLTTIFDEFNDGLYHPVAIKRFLAYAYQHWQRPAPQYVLLVGDGHWNFFGRRPEVLPTATPLMPPNMAWVDPWQGQVDSSNQLAAFVGNDILPDILLGRLPVRDASEIANVLAKIQAHENAPTEASWRRLTTFIADNGPDPAGDFAGSLRRTISDSVPAPPLVVQQLFLDEYCGPRGQSEPNCPRLLNALIETVNVSGTLLITYAGHAAIQNWSHENFMNVSRAGLLNTTSMPPLTLSLGCLDGYWIYPGRESLIETFVRQSGGPVASFAPTGLGLATGHELLAHGFFRQLFAGGPQRVGSATLAARLRLFATGSSLDLIDTYTLFGDPALRVAIPDELQPPPPSVTPTPSVAPTNPTDGTGTPTVPTSVTLTPTTPTNVTVTPTTPTSETMTPTVPTSETTTPTMPTSETMTPTTPTNVTVTPTTPTVTPGPGELRRVYLPRIGR